MVKPVVHWDDSVDSGEELVSRRQDALRSRAGQGGILARRCSTASSAPAALKPQVGSTDECPLDAVVVPDGLRGDVVPGQPGEAQPALPGGRPQTVTG